MVGKVVNILAIESSCDDTSAAVIQNEKILSNYIANQEIHSKFGGVVPELASRAHQQNIVPVVEEALKKAAMTKEELDAIAFTIGPGLLGSLIVGASYAKGLAMSLDIPMIGVNHMKGHIMAHFIDQDKPKPSFPFICLTVSGGHTQLVHVKSYSNMEVIGSTIDDAAGEAFDKAAKIMGLPYPGGPLIDKYGKDGDIEKYEFPISSLQGYDFSFSGLKTSILYFLQKEMKKNPDFIKENMSDICASYQHTIIKTLFKKLIKASKDLGIKDIAIAGGVSANSYLRSELERVGENRGWNTFIPEFQYCTDNAGMIAIAGYHQFLAGEFTSYDAAPQARLPL
ncbi:MAG: tRNA (adenosine(37)-N6)-threonylcarbamoyltransferase complex transferase subunit TsaD [Crocinitomicaceae bacterium]|nr:tRNA (adenosine(37)-N6)-threonylcarbamoyltransferase complex transferase subunit TsaD [Crocinitomicaceae bacterium]